MNYGLYLSANGISSLQHRMNALSNNLANVNTTGFKPMDVVFGEREREPQSMRSQTDSNQLLQALGGGTQIGYSGPNLRQGAVSETGINTDVALVGKGFLHLEDTPNNQHQMTRDGRLRFDSQGTLRHSASGLAVLDDGGRQIQLGADERMRFAGFADNGDLLDRDDLKSPFARLGLVSADETQLRQAGGNLFQTKAKLADASDTDVRSAALEASAADPVGGMVQLIKLTRAIEMNSRLIQYQDAMIGQAVTSLGRVV